VPEALLQSMPEMLMHFLANQRKTYLNRLPKLLESQSFPAGQKAR